MSLKPSKVYHAPVEKSIDDSVYTMRNILEHRSFRLFRSFCRQQLIGLHISYKQPEWNRGLLSPFVKEAVSSLKEKDTWAFLCDTSERHKKKSSNAMQQIQEIYSTSSLSELQALLPFFMLDGINGNYEYVTRSPDDSVETYIGGEIPNLDGLVIFSVPFQHELCGLANALFCVGAGLASKRGKIKLHTQNKPQINVEKCNACRRCLYECPVDAISMGDRHVILDDDKCVDCGRCVEIAGRCGVSYNWNATPDYFQTRMLQQAASCMEILAPKIIFITVIPLNEGNFEILISRDPVAIDSETLNILRHNNLFDESICSSFEHQIELAQHLGIGTMKYTKEVIAY